MRAEPLTRSALGGSGDDFVLVQWTAEVGDHWIAPLHVHHDDDEAWYVLQGRLGFRLGGEQFEVGPVWRCWRVTARRTRIGTPETSRLTTCSLCRRGSRR